MFTTNTGAPISESDAFNLVADELFRMERDKMKNLLKDAATYLPRNMNKEFPFERAMVKAFLAFKISKVKCDKSIFEKALAEFKEAAHDIIDAAMDTDATLAEHDCKNGIVKVTKGKENTNTSACLTSTTTISTCS